MDSTSRHSPPILQGHWLPVKGTDNGAHTHGFPERGGRLHFSPSASHISGGDPTAEPVLMNGLSLCDYFCKGRLILKAETTCEMKRNRWGILELDSEGGNWGASNTQLTAFSFTVNV